MRELWFYFILLGFTLYYTFNEQVTVTMRGQKKEEDTVLGLSGRAYESSWSFSWTTKDTKMQKGGCSRGHSVRIIVGMKVRRWEVQGGTEDPMEGRRRRRWEMSWGGALNFFFSLYFIHVHVHMNSVRCDRPSLHFPKHFLLAILNI